MKWRCINLFLFLATWWSYFPFCCKYTIFDLVLLILIVCMQMGSHLKAVKQYIEELLFMSYRDISVIVFKSVTSALYWRCTMIADDKEFLKMTRWMSYKQMTTKWWMICTADMGWEGEKKKAVVWWLTLFLSTSRHKDNAPILPGPSPCSIQSRVRCIMLHSALSW